MRSKQIAIPYRSQKQNTYFFSNLSKPSSVSLLLHGVRTHRIAGIS